MFSGGPCFVNSRTTEISFRCLGKLDFETQAPTKRSCSIPSTSACSTSSSQTAASRWRSAGVIAGYRAELDPRALGFSVSAIVRIRPAPGQLQRIPEVARETPEVAECHRITGDDCYLLRLHLRSIDDLEDVLDRFTPFGLTTTSIVHSTPVPRRGPPLVLRP
jgi:Lrp/AsnC family leucine-responsive transcriptional regulator